jgi:hypothetical protein
MYYKDSPYDKVSHPMGGYPPAYYGSSAARTPLLPQGYQTGDGKVMNAMESIRDYFMKPWVIASVVILVILIIIWLMSGKDKESFYNY